MIINPYELLGVSTQSSLSDVKKAYYELALIMHPDKGGREEDMIILQHAYSFVVYELSQSKTIETYESLQTAFEQFCKVQEESVPQFQDIYAEAFDLPKFNDYFNAISITDSTNVWKGSYEHGYGDLMEQSGEYETTPYITPLQHSFSNTLIEYASPQEVLGGFPALYDYSMSNAIDDFTCNDMYDYQQTFTKQETQALTTEENVMNRTLSMLQKEREEQLPQPSSMYVWSYRGFIDENGNRVKDYKSLM